MVSRADDDWVPAGPQAACGAQQTCVSMTQGRLALIGLGLGAWGLGLGAWGLGLGAWGLGLGAWGLGLGAWGLGLRA